MSFLNAKNILSLLNVKGITIPVSHESNRRGKKIWLDTCVGQVFALQIHLNNEFKQLFILFQSESWCRQKPAFNSIMAQIYADKTLKIQKQEHLLNYLFKFESSVFCGWLCLYAPSVAFLFCPILIYKLYLTQSPKVGEPF